ncbi:MAG: 5,6-dimethylbenzimidazole synthase [Brachymonas sp.]|jgi:5,6-dimethylbenzimidazole synthase
MQDRPHAYSLAEREALYKAIRERRDMRHFSPGASVPPATLLRILQAAHMGPSVGFMQPWRFLRITQAAQREALVQVVTQEQQATAEALGERKAEFLRLKVEGIRDCAELIACCLMPQREQHIFGRRTMPYMDIASIGCALQNLWLAARAEGLGLGWVSIFDPVELAKVLNLPEDAQPLALLCIGPVPAFYEEPMLQQTRWASRMPLADVLFDDAWGQASSLLAAAPAAAPTHPPP